MASKLKSYVARIRGHGSGNEGHHDDGHGSGKGGSVRGGAVTGPSSRFYTTCEMCLSIRAAVRAEDAFCSDACSKKALANMKPRRDNSLTNVITIKNPEFQKIHAHARWNRPDELTALLKNGCPIDLPDANKNTPLIVAAQNGHGALVRSLVEAGAQVNAQNMTGNTAAHFAATYGYDDIYAYLMAHGGDPTITNKDGVAATADAKVGKASAGAGQPASNEEGAATAD